MHWIEKPIHTTKEIQKFAKANHISTTLSTLLLQRNVDEVSKTTAFLNPKLEELHDPFLMQDMDKAVNRLIQAIDNQEKILVYGDYDVDGTSSVATFFGFLNDFYPHMEYYIPDRYKEGYGVSFQGIDYAADNNFGLIVSIDCGIKAHEKIDYALTKKVDFIVCDHHTPSETLPNAVAILDPKRIDCEYPFNELCGCGVAFKLLQAYCIKTNRNLKPLFERLDIVAVATAADIVPIVGENRILVYYGLKKINKNPSLGIKALMSLTNYEGNYNVMNVAFGIAPRINAAGRIKHAHYAVEVLLSKSEKEAEAHAKEIDDFNQTRKDLDSSITEEALEMIASDEKLKNAKSTVLYGENWHKGVIGIVASRCIESHYRPTIILTKSGDKVVGSARSVLGYSVYDAILACEDTITQFGGHKYAAGLTLTEEQVKPFQEKFEEYVAKTISEEQVTPQLDIDMSINLDKINQEFYDDFVQVAPFGPMNEEPVFITRNVYIKRLQTMKEEHLRLELYQNEQKSVNALGFKMSKIAPKFRHGVPFDITYTLQENEYKGIKKIQLVLKDIHFS